MLTLEERTRITEEFADALLDADFRAQLVRNVFPDKIDHRAILASGTVVPRDLAVITVTACLASRWTRTPSMLETLLNYLVNVRGVGGLDAIRARVAQRTDPNDAVYDATWLLDNTRPFFDRRDLRKKARLLIEGNGKSVLLVACDQSGYGRSYSLDFLAHVASSRPGDVGVLAAAVSEGGGPSYSVESLLGEFSAQLGSTEPVPQRTRASYAESAVLWLLRPLMAPGPRWLLVLDGFGQDGVAPEVHETIQRLARQVATVPLYRNRIRLVLLGYPPVVPGLPVTDLLTAKLPGVTQASLLTETPAPAAGIAERDLLPCLEAWDALRRAEGLPGMAADELVKLAGGLLARAPAAGKERLAVLHTDLLSLLDPAEGALDGAF